MWTILTMSVGGKNSVKLVTATRETQHVYMTRTVPQGAVNGSVTVNYESAKLKGSLGEQNHSMAVPI